MMKINVTRLDEHTTYRHWTRNGGFKSVTISIDERRQESVEERKQREANGITKVPTFSIYTRKNLRQYYSTYKGELEFDEKNCFIINNKENLIFSPITKAKNIVGYACIQYKDYNKIDGKGAFTQAEDKECGKKYILVNGVRLHEIIFGRKADKGGWKKLGEMVETDDMTERTWHYGVESPHNKLGKDGDFYRDKNGMVYLKFSKNVIDHINSDTFDNRSFNLREVSYGVNAVNRTKTEGTTSRYLGVNLHPDGSWVGGITHEGTKYVKHFKLEEDAAKFRDIYAVLLYKIPISNNDTLTGKEIEDILENGENAIPDKYKKFDRSSRELPKNIYMRYNKYRCIKRYNHKYYESESYDTLEEAKKALPSVLEKIELLILKENMETKEKNRVNVFEDHAYFITHDKFGNPNGKFKVNLVIWEKYGHYKWYKVAGYARVSNGEDNIMLHILVYTFFNPDYCRLIDGTIDHSTREKNDCTIENLDAVTNSHQKQNRDMPKKLTYLLYQGVYLSHDKFTATIKHQGEVFGGERRIYLEDAAADYNQMVKDIYGKGKLNIIPETRTTALDLFHREKMTEEFIENISTLAELKSIFSINKEWMVRANIINIKDIDIERKTLKYYIDILKKLKQEDVNCVQTFLHPLHRDNLTFADLDRIDAINIMIEVFTVNRDWRRDEGVRINLYNDLKKPELDYYRNLAKKYLQQEYDRKALMGHPVKARPYNEDLYHKDNLTISYVKSITHVVKLEKILRSNKEWKPKGAYRSMKLVRIEELRRIIIQNLHEYLGTEEETEYLYSFGLGAKINGTAKINAELYETYSNINWKLSSDGIFEGNYLGNNLDLRGLIYQEYNPDYDSEKYGLPEFKNGNKTDYTLKNLYCALYCQLKNRRNDRMFIYQGVRMKVNKFYAEVTIGKSKETSGKFLYIEDAAKAYNELVIKHEIRSDLNDVPNTKTSVKDLFDKDKLTVSFVLNSNLAQMRSILGANPEWKKLSGFNLENTQNEKTMAPCRIKIAKILEDYIESKEEEEENVEEIFEEDLENEEVFIPKEIEKIDNENFKDIPKRNKLVLKIMDKND